MIVWCFLGTNDTFLLGYSLPNSANMDCSFLTCSLFACVTGGLKATFLAGNEGEGDYDSKGVLSNDTLVLILFFGLKYAFKEF